MPLTQQERALTTYALGLYRAAAKAGDKPMPAGGLEEIDGIVVKLSADTKQEMAAEYHGIGKRRTDCLCKICQTVLEGQLREVLGRIPAAERAAFIARAESVLDGKGAA